MELTIRAARAKEQYTSIRGQAPPDFSGITKWAGMPGADSIWLNSDSAMPMTRVGPEAERRQAVN